MALITKKKGARRNIYTKKDEKYCAELKTLNEKIKGKNKYTYGIPTFSLTLSVNTVYNIFPSFPLLIYFTSSRLAWRSAKSIEKDYYYFCAKSSSFPNTLFSKYIS